METGNYSHQRLAVPPSDLKWMACCVNTVIEVLELPLKKLSKPGIKSVADAVTEITKNRIPITSEGFVSILIQEFIDETYQHKRSVRKLMELCEEKYDYLEKTGILT